MDRQVLTLDGCNYAGCINGFQIYLAPEYKMPNKVHHKTGSMSNAYHKRVQKKWLKRFGFHYTSVVADGELLEFRQAKAYVMNLRTFNNFKQAMEKKK